MIPTSLAQGLNSEHRRELLRSADRWRTLRMAIADRRAAAGARRERFLAAVAAPPAVAIGPQRALRRTPGADSVAACGSAGMQQAR